MLTLFLRAHVYSSMPFVGCWQVPCLQPVAELLQQAVNMMCCLLTMNLLAKCKWQCQYWLRLSCCMMWWSRVFTLGVEPSVRSVLSHPVTA